MRHISAEHRAAIRVGWARRRARLAGQVRTDDVITSYRRRREMAYAKNRAAHMRYLHGDAT
jgi:hypothetical protein